MTNRVLTAGLFLAGISAVLSAQSPATSKKAPAKVAPHIQTKLPPLDLPEYQLPRPKEVVQTLYKFAAEHPEVLNYMPCFCSCEQMGHRSNEDCFVKSRAKNGDVTAWEEHGIACAMCLAVAERAKQMCDKGSALSDIRADIERRYGHITGTATPTPQPPKK